MTHPSRPFSSRTPEKSPESNALCEWFKILQDSPGIRAELRRAKNINAAYFCQGFYMLWSRLRSVDCKIKDENIAAIAVLLCHVKSDVPGPTDSSKKGAALQMATPRTGSSPVVSPARFRKLLLQHDKENAVRHCIRLVKILGGNVDIVSLAWAFANWNEGARTKWAMAYYSTVDSKELD